MATDCRDYPCYIVAIWYNTYMKIIGKYELRGTSYSNPTFRRRYPLTMEVKRKHTGRDLYAVEKENGHYIFITRYKIRQHYLKV
jgi:hypothetical protein